MPVECEWQRTVLCNQEYVASKEWSLHIRVENVLRKDPNLW